MKISKFKIGDVVKLKNNYFQLDRIDYLFKISEVREGKFNSISYFYYYIEDLDGTSIHSSINGFSDSELELDTISYIRNKKNL